jgi:hypothetical protein
MLKSMHHVAGTLPFWPGIVLPCLVGPRGAVKDTNPVLSWYPRWWLQPTLTRLLGRWSIIMFSRRSQEMH